MARHTRVTPALHSAGATVLHRSPFDELVVPTSSGALSADLRDRWVTPFYMSVRGDVETMGLSLRPVFREIDASLIATLLSVFDWRPRIVGAFFVALCRIGEFEDVVGRLLLRSDVCYAGRGYCLALARLNTPRSIEFIREYLQYYLTRQDLWFDQGDAMAALQCIDVMNGTSHCSDFTERWASFTRDKPNWSLSKSITRFGADLAAIEALHARCSRPADEAD